jgi:hypothetical protein
MQGLPYQGHGSFSKLEADSGDAGFRVNSQMAPLRRSAFGKLASALSPKKNRRESVSTISTEASTPGGAAEFPSPRRFSLSNMRAAAKPKLSPEPTAAQNVNAIRKQQRRMSANAVVSNNPTSVVRQQRRSSVTNNVSPSTTPIATNNTSAIKQQRRMSANATGPEPKPGNLRQVRRSSLTVSATTFPMEDAIGPETKAGNVRVVRRSILTANPAILVGDATGPETKQNNLRQIRRSSLTANTAIPADGATVPETKLGNLRVVRRSSLNANATISVGDAIGPEMRPSNVRQVRRSSLAANAAVSMGSAIGLEATTSTVRRVRRSSLTAATAIPVGKATGPETNDNNRQALKSNLKAGIPMEKAAGLGIKNGTVQQVLKSNLKATVPAGTAIGPANTRDNVRQARRSSLNAAASVEDSKIRQGRRSSLNTSVQTGSQLGRGSVINTTGRRPATTPKQPHNPQMFGVLQADLPGFLGTNMLQPQGKSAASLSRPAHVAPILQQQPVPRLTMTKMSGHSRGSLGSGGLMKQITESPQQRSQRSLNSKGSSTTSPQPSQGSSQSKKVRLPTCLEPNDDESSNSLHWTSLQPDLNLESELRNARGPLHASLGASTTIMNSASLAAPKRQRRASISGVLPYKNLGTQALGDAREIEIAKLKAEIAALQAKIPQSSFVNDFKVNRDVSPKGSPHANLNRSPHSSFSRHSPHTSFNRISPHASFNRTSPHSSFNRSISEQFNDGTPTKPRRKFNCNSTEYGMGDEPYFSDDPGESFDGEPIMRHHEKSRRLTRKTNSAKPLDKNVDEISDKSTKSQHLLLDGAPLRPSRTFNVDSCQFGSEEISKSSFEENGDEHTFLDETEGWVEEEADVDQQSFFEKTMDANDRVQIPSNTNFLYECARKCQWTLVELECRTNPRDAKCISERDGTTALHLAVMSRSNPMMRDGSLAGYSSAPISTIEVLLKAAPEAAITRCATKKYTPLSYACLVADSEYDMEDAAAMVAMILKHAEQSAYVFTDDGFSALDIHILSYSRLHRNHKQEVLSGKRSSTFVLQRLLEDAPFLAQPRPYKNKIRGPLELLYRSNLRDFQESVEVSGDDHDTFNDSRRGGLTHASTLSEWWAWKWTLILLKFASLEDEDDKKTAVSGVHAAARCVGCPTPILALTVGMFPKQVEDRNPRKKVYNLPLHEVCSWRCDKEIISGDPFVMRRKANAIDLLLDEYPNAARTTNNHGETPLQLAIESCTFWDGGLERLVKACPKALKFPRKLRNVKNINHNMLSVSLHNQALTTERQESEFLLAINGMYPFMVAAIFGRIPESRRRAPSFLYADESAKDLHKQIERKELESLRSIYGLLRMKPDVLQRYIDSIY